MCGQATCSMSTRMFVEGHPPGLLLVFYRLWEQIQSGMSVGVIQSQWGALSWWWNAMNACLKDGMSKQPQHTLKDGLTNQKLRLTLFKQAISIISQKVTKCWVTLGTVTIAFVQPVTGWIQHEAGQLNKACPYSERWLRSPLRQAPARVFRHGKLKIHKTYNGPVPLTYVNTGVYEGGGNDYYDAYTEQDLCWARSLNCVLKYHQIPRWEACNYKTNM